jgi:hypothetical protein
VSAVVVNPSYLDFSQFCKTLYIRLYSTEKITYPSLGQVTDRLKSDETTPDSDAQTKMAKVQSYKTGHKRQKPFMLMDRTPILP